MTYIIPFKKLPVKVGQKFNEGSHKKWEEDKEDFTYSMDFLLPEGTEIIASRSGVVTKVKSNGKGNYSGKDIKNRMFTWHTTDDGSFKFNNIPFGKYLL